MFKKKKKTGSARNYRTSQADAQPHAINTPNSNQNESNHDERQGDTIDDTVVVRENKKSQSVLGKRTIAQATTTANESNNTSNTNNHDDNGLLHTYSASADASSSKMSRIKDDAFRTNEYESSSTRDVRSLHEEKVMIMESGSTNDETGLYRGMNAYSGIIKKSVDSIRANKHTGAHGALRANTFVRTTSRFDYQPDVCKDYFQTGFCGFGDTCIFMHDRTDMKKGWELEEEWERKKRERREKEERAMRCLVVGGDVKGGEGLPDDGIPFACGICRGPFKDPIVTECGHHFCGGCARSRYKVDKTCEGCGKDTGGVFNKPRKLEKKCKKVADGDWKVFMEVKGGKVT